MRLIPVIFYDIQIKAESGDWETVGMQIVEENTNSYGFDYKTAMSGTLYMRIRQIGQDGSLEISEEILTELIAPEYIVSQNFPNPFNPFTKLNYTIPFDSKIKINLYTITGEYVKTLEEGNKTAGIYSYNLDASDLASGVYFYLFEAESTDGLYRITDAKKMVLIK
jgi:hypothetical protein